MAFSLEYFCQLSHFRCQNVPSQCPVWIIFSVPKKGPCQTKVDHRGAANYHRYVLGSMVRTKNA